VGFARGSNRNIAMLDAMRRGVTNIFTKFLLALLIVAFAIWGIGDVVRRSSQAALATVGKTEITAEEFRQAYQDEMQSIARRLGRRLTPEQAKLAGVEMRALARLIGVTSIDLHARDLHVTVAESIVANIIKADPAFHGLDGKFSRPKFRQAIVQQGYRSEDQYIQARRRDLLREQLTETVGAGVAPSKALLDAVHGFREETRDIEHITPDADKLIKIAEPEEKKLREFYLANMRQYIALEQRKANMLLLTRNDALARTTVTDEEIKAAYEAGKETHNIPEKRKVSQLTFPDKAAAEKAYSELAKAKNFDEAATKLGFAPADTDLGLLTRAEMIDAKIGDAAFALKKNELSRPIEGQFSVVLLRVADIEAGKQRTLDDVKTEIKDRIADERVGQQLQALHEKAEAQRAKGKPLSEIAQALKLPFVEVAGLNRLGKTPEGKPAVEHADAGRIAEAVFEATAGVETDSLELTDGGHAWFDLVAITPERQKPFDEVKDEVRTSFIEAEKRKEIASLAAKQVDRLKAGEKLEAIAKELGAKVERTGAIKRSATPPGLTATAMQSAFALPKGGAGSSPTADGKSRVIFRVVEVTPAPEATPEQLATLKTDLGKQLRIDVLDQYVGGLRTRYGYTVNEKALRQALGPAEQQQDTDDN
jgi:peptidyl-prolyl cis-trans isomerase D